MAASTTRVARGDRPTVVMPRSESLDPDVAMVGGPDDASIHIVNDDPMLAGLKDEEWDGLDESQRGGGASERRQERQERREERASEAQGQGQPDEQGEEEEEEDARLAYDEDEGVRGRGRRHRRNRNLRMRREAESSELQELRQTVSHLTGRLNQLTGGQIDQTANQLEQVIANSDRALGVLQTRLAAAIKDADGDAAATLMAERDRIAADKWKAERQLEGLEAQVRRMQEGGRAAPREERPQLTREQQAELQERNDQFEQRRDVFLDRFTWFDPEADPDIDRDHLLVHRIDRRLTAEGLERHTAAFWREMERELRREGIRPDMGEDPDDRRRDRRRDDDDEERPRRRNGGRAMDGRRYGGPRTGAVRATQRNGRDRNGSGREYQLSEIEFQMLRDEGLDGNDLSEADQAKKDRLINKWSTGKAEYTRRTGRAWR